MGGARGTIGLALLIGGGALAFAVGAGFNPLQAIQAWANSASTHPAMAPEPDKSIAANPATSGGKAP